MFAYGVGVSGWARWLGTESGEGLGSTLLTALCCWSSLACGTRVDDSRCGRDFYARPLLVVPS